MKKAISVALVILVILLMASPFFIRRAEAYNGTLFDTTYHFDKAQILMPDGTAISGIVEKWKDWENSDAIQVKMDGKTYYTHISNVVLIAE